VGFFETHPGAYIKENPMDIDLLNGLPEVKARTGLKDISIVAKSMRRCLI